jgi:hypothetical protein
MGMGAENLEEKAVRSFSAKFPALVPHLISVPVEDSKGRAVPGQFALMLRFESKKSADGWRLDLAVWEVEGYLPFEGSRPFPAN